MSADNQYVILQELDGTYTVRMIFISALDNFEFYDAPCDEWPYETPEDMARAGRIYFQSNDLNECYEWANEQAKTLDGYAEYGVAIWCPHKICGCIDEITER